MVFLTSGPSKLREEILFVQGNTWISHLGMEDETLKIQVSKRLHRVIKQAFGVGDEQRDWDY